MVWHHFCGILAMLSALLVGYSIPGAISTSMLAEISGIFMNYRNMTSPDNVNSALYFYNQLAFFLTFTIFRMILFPVLVYKCWLVAFLILDEVSLLRKLAFINFGIQVHLILFLNVFWYTLLLKKAHSVIFGKKNNLTENKAEDDYSKINDKSENESE